MSEKGANTVSGPEMQDQRIVFGRYTRSREEVLVKEGLEIAEGAKPLVRGCIPVGLGVVFIPELWSADFFLVLFRRHMGFVRWVGGHIYSRSKRVSAPTTEQKMAAPSGVERWFRPPIDVERTKNRC